MSLVRFENQTVTTFGPFSHEPLSPLLSALGAFSNVDTVKVFLHVRPMNWLSWRCRLEFPRRSFSPS